MAARKQADDWGDFADVAKTHTYHGARKSCAVRTLYMQLQIEYPKDGVDKCESIEKACANFDLSANSIIKALDIKLGAGWDLPRQWSVQRHRKRECSCPRGGVDVILASQDSA